MGLLLAFRFASICPPELGITNQERAFIEELTPLLSDSPRVLKRFANTYRLLRAGLSPTEQAGFADGTSDKVRICMFQLAVLVCLRRFAREYLSVVRQASGLLAFLDWLGLPGKVDEGHQHLNFASEWSRLQELCSQNTAVRTGIGVAKMDEAKFWAEKAARYSFVSPDEPPARLEPEPPLARNLPFVPPQGSPQVITGK